MKTFIRHIFLFFAALLIVAATGGISLFQHYCSCHDEKQSSLFTETIQCHHEKQDACCEVELPGKSRAHCSTDDSSEKEAHHNHDGHDCCSTVYSYYKTDQVHLKKPVVAPQKFYNAFILIFHEPHADQDLSGSYLKQWQTHPPIALHGKDLLCFINQRKLATPYC